MKTIKKVEKKNKSRSTKTAKKEKPSKKKRRKMTPSNKELTCCKTHSILFSVVILSTTVVCFPFFSFPLSFFQPRNVSRNVSSILRFPAATLPFLRNKPRNHLQTQTQRQIKKQNKERGARHVVSFLHRTPCRHNSRMDACVFDPMVWSSPHIDGTARICHHVGFVAQRGMFACV